jgi:hypothetical protein
LGIRGDSQKIPGKVMAKKNKMLKTIVMHHVENVKTTKIAEIQYNFGILVYFVEMPKYQNWCRNNANTSVEAKRILNLCVGSYLTFVKGFDTFENPKELKMNTFFFAE